MNFAFLASYNGSSAQAITDACFDGTLRASPILLISNNRTAGALEWAENKGLKTFCLNDTTHPDLSDLDNEIAQKLLDNKINILILSGYMKLLGPRTMDAVNGKVLNIHPALLPKYGGKGMYGNNVHKAVKASGDDKTGITIHLVDSEYDEGKILAQKEISLQSTDSIEDIANKVRAAEPEFYVETLDKILKGDIEI